MGNNFGFYMQLTYGSMCSGIEAASVAWGSLGWVPTWFSEIDKFASSVLAHHWPGVRNLGDMTRIADLIDLGGCDAPDVLVGGTPCQSFSVAGARRGLEDARGQLAFAFANTADAIDRSRADDGKEPCVVVWENVPGVLSDKSNAFGCILAALAGEDVELQPPGKKWPNAGCVFGPTRTVAWRILDAQYFGLAQRRRRVFVVASARIGFNPTQVLFEFDSLRRDTAPSRGARTAVAALTANGVGTCGADDNQGQAGHLIPTAGCWWDGGQVSQTLDAVLAKGQTMPDKNRFPAVLQPVAFNHNALAAQLPGPTRDTTVSETLTGSQQAAVAYPLQEVGKRTGVSTSDVRAGLGVGSDVDPMFTLLAGAQHGIGVTIHGTHPSVQKVASYDDVAQCLRARTPGSLDNSSTTVALSEMVVRRLTPTECERLQGFPDGHTDVPHRGKPSADGPRYKAIGNSMAVPVMQWIGRRIEMALTNPWVEDDL